MHFFAGVKKNLELVISKSAPLNSPSHPFVIGRQKEKRLHRRVVALRRRWPDPFAPLHPDHKAAVCRLQAPSVLLGQQAGRAGQGDEKVSCARHLLSMFMNEPIVMLYFSLRLNTFQPFVLAVRKVRNRGFLNDELLTCSFGTTKLQTYTNHVQTIF